MRRPFAVLLALALLLPAGVTAKAAPGELAVATTQTVEVDGKGVVFETYALLDANGFQTNYAKLRDVASVLNGTAAQFSVDWSAREGIGVVTGRAYTPDGTEMKTPYQGDRACQRLSESTTVDAAPRSIAAIRLYDDDGNGYTYYKLRDLGEHLGFHVDWSARRGVYVETDKVYGGAEREAVRVLTGSWTGKLDFSAAVTGVMEKWGELKDHFRFGRAEAEVSLTSADTGRYVLSMDEASFADALARIKADYLSGMLSYAEAKAKEAGGTLDQVLAKSNQTRAEFTARLEREFDNGMAPARESILERLAASGVWKTGRDGWVLTGGDGQSIPATLDKDALTLRVDETTELTLRRK